MEHVSWQTGAQGRLHSGTWALWLLLCPSQTQGCICASLDPSPWLGTQERNVLLSNYITIYFDLYKRSYLMTVSFMWCAYRMTTYRVTYKSLQWHYTHVPAKHCLIYNQPLAESHNVELQILFKLLSANLNPHFIPPKHWFTNCCT
jgi:hypothetical protein